MGLLAGVRWPVAVSLVIAILPARFKGAARLPRVRAFICARTFRFLRLLWTRVTRLRMRRALLQRSKNRFALERRASRIWLTVYFLVQKLTALPQRNQR